MRHLGYLPCQKSKHYQKLNKNPEKLTSGPVMNPIFFVFCAGGVNTEKSREGNIKKADLFDNLDKKCPITHEILTSGRGPGHGAVLPLKHIHFNDLFISFCKCCNLSAATSSTVWSHTLLICEINTDRTE